MISFLQDLRYGVASLVKHRGFTVAALLSLGLGIGLNTTIFTFVNAIFLQPLPVRNSSELASIVTLDSRIPGYFGSSYPNYQDYRRRTRCFSSLLLYASFNGSLTDLGDPQPLSYQIVSGDYFQALGVAPDIGRAFQPEENASEDTALVAVISDSLWKSRFGGDARIVGRAVGVNGHQFQVVGVAPPGFQGLNLLNPADLWIPLAGFRQVYPSATWVDGRRNDVFSVAGRLKPGVTLEQAEAEMRAVADQLEREYPRDNEGRRTRLIPLNETATPRAQRATLSASSKVLMIVSGLILLIACANVSNLLLARAAGRNKEIAVRLALGASRWRLIRQLLMESLVVALAGGLVAVLLARWASGLLWALRPPAFRAAVYHVALDARVLGFTLAISVITGLVFGLIPAIRSTKPDLVTDLKERASYSGSGLRANHPRSLLVAFEVALCVVSLVGAGLFIRSLINADHADPGFDPDRLGTVSFDLADRSYTHERGFEMQRRVLERAAQIPGVVSVALSRDPMLTVKLTRTVTTDEDSNGQGRPVLASSISPGYFRTTGIALIRGRDFSPRDSLDAPRVAIVNQVAAARFWPGRDPLGQRLRFAGAAAPLEVVGVARNAAYVALGEQPAALVYTSMLQEYDSPTTLIFRAAGSPEILEGRVRSEVQAMDPGLLLRSTSVRSVILASLWAPRLSAGLLSIFGILGLALATLGVYGVVSYSVNQRVREIGVRMAIGATAADVQRLILRQGLAVVTVGVVAGLVIALGASRLVQSLLFVTSARDALTFILVPSILILAAIAACWLPAHRATRIDPIIALRHE